LFFFIIAKKFAVHIFEATNIPIL